MLVEGSCDYIGFYGTPKVMLLDSAFMERRRTSLSSKPGMFIAFGLFWPWTVSIPTTESTPIFP